MPPVYISKYNRYVDNILERVNKVLRNGYDPVNVRLHTVKANKKQPVKKDEKKKNKNKGKKKPAKKNGNKKKKNNGGKRHRQQQAENIARAIT